MILNTAKSENPVKEALSSLRKAAMLLIVLGEQTSAELLQQLTEEEVQKVSREVAKITSISAEQAEMVLNEFHHIATAGEYVARGGMDFARKLLTRAFSPDTAQRLLERLTRAIGADASSFDAIQKADPQQLAKFIHNEHPQTIALVLSHLATPQAAALLTSLPPGLRADVAGRMANLDQISPEIIGKIAGVIGQKLKALGEFSRESYGGVRAVAEMLNRLDSGSSREILETIEAQDTNLAGTIRHLMFVFEDLLLIDPMGLKEVLGKVDRKVLTTALKGTSEKLRNQICGCLSQRAAEMLREDMDALGPVKIKDVDSAQQQIIAVVRQLEADGALNLQGAVGEQYVV
jgi:flagellar motor switch protein FliG